MKEIYIDIHNSSILNLKEFVALFKGLKDGKYLVSIKDVRRRSLSQNGYYWAVVVPACRKGLYDIGYDEVRTDQEAHEFLKTYHLKKQVVNKQTGEVIEMPGNTSELSIPEFNEFIETVCKWAAIYLGIAIPSPNNQFSQFEEWEKYQTR